jgi:hypothetical protein
MNTKNTWLWMMVALGLFAFIYFFHRKKPPTGPAKVLPGLKASEVTSVLVRPGPQLNLEAVHTNGAWQLTIERQITNAPVSHPAQALAISNLLSALANLTPVTQIKASELKDRPKAEEEFGLSSPQATITVDQPDYHALLQIGAKTAPGDQVFLRVVGEDGLYVVDADILKHIPHTADDWRDTALVDLNSFVFDRVSVTNGAKIFELRRDPTNQLWRMFYPFPQPARANNEKIHESLELIHSLRARDFLADDPKPDLEALGLQRPELEVALGEGTNTLVLLQFGKSPTNDGHLVYARRVDQNAVVTVAAELVTPWRGKLNDFRDPHLVNLHEPVGALEVNAEENFTIQQRTNAAWQVLAQDVPVDAGLVNELIANLGRMQIVDFGNDVVIAADLPAYGLAPPARQYILKSAATNAPGMTNNVIVELDFGTNQDGKVFARRPDENFVYSVKAADVQALPTAAWQLRKREIFNFSTNDVVSLTIQQDGRTRTIKRNGPFSWSFASNSQGILNDLAVEVTVSELGQLSAGTWVARGAENRARYGIADNGYRITFELKNGTKPVLEFGGEAPSGFRYAAITQEGTVWIFEFPPGLYQTVSTNLTAPPGP